MTPRQRARRTSHTPVSAWKTNERGRDAAACATTQPRRWKSAVSWSKPRVVIATIEGTAACTVRYGGRTYRMDAITTRGFDQDTADFQRRGCVVAQAAASRPGSFVFHADTGVCEVRRAP